ncbi:MAG TPA: pantetheine-phosphate adenylyltransferase [Acidimicrobiia bacterium]|nr:pantetheine-phosphate adenylyltransferase [Acidimicrobiia bacterium]
MSHALCPGSFDPPTVGHIEIIERAATLFDEVTVAVIRNATKQATLTSEERVDFLNRCLKSHSNVSVLSFDGLLVDCAREAGANVVVKGLRAISDFDYELQMAQMNRQLSHIETVFLSTNPQHSFLSSSMVRDIARYGGDVSSLVPAVIAADVASRFALEASDV